MKLFGLLLVSTLAACNAKAGPDGYDHPDAGALDDSSGTGDDGGGNGSGDDGGNHGGSDGGSGSDGGNGGSDGGSNGNGGVVPLAACASAPTTYATLPTGVTFPPQQTDPGPLMTRDERAFLFLESSALWTTANAGAASTGARPAAIADGNYFGGFPSLSGITAITYLKNGVPHATTFDGTTWGPERTNPCTAIGVGCVAHAAGDGHLWFRFNNVFYEQTGATYANRGGGPASPLYWDVDAAGTVIVLSTGEFNSGDKLVVWKLPANAGGWSKVGALRDADVAAVGAQIEGGFQFGAAGPGTIAPDGSIHLFSDARCIGTGQRNKAQAYARSRDGITWSVELLPNIDDLHAGNKTWKHAAFWASDYDNARYVVTSSITPAYDGWNWIYPDRRYDVIGRCLDASNNPTFGRLASTRLRGWTTRGYASFSETGAAALLTDEGLTQVE